MFGEIAFRLVGGITWLLRLRRSMPWARLLHTTSLTYRHVKQKCCRGKKIFKRKLQPDSLAEWAAATGSLCHCSVRLNVIYESVGPDKWAVKPALCFLVRGLELKRKTSYVHTFWFFFIMDRLSMRHSHPWDEPMMLLNTDFSLQHWMQISLVP